MASPQISSAANLVSAGFGVAVVPSSMRQVQVGGVSYHERVVGGEEHGGARDIVGLRDAFERLHA
jgi:hypothetical protein